MSRLDKSFYLRPTLDVARDLLGKVLVFNSKRAVITQTEAYIGPVDKACHAFGYKRTKRTEIMFKEGGHIYVYLIYGMYCCLNIVTEKEGEPCAVLIRGIEGISGPGKLCKALGITKEHNGLDLFGPDVFIEEGESVLPDDIETGKRINIDYAEEAKDFPWRFSIRKR